MRAKEVMSDGVMSVRSDATVLEAAKLLVNMRVSAMPVLDEDGMMVGIVSEADLVGLTAAGATAATAGMLRELADESGAPAAYEFARSTRVTEVMCRDVATVEDSASLLEVAELMRERRIKRVPVLRGKSVVGIVSRADLLKALISYASTVTGGSARNTDPAEPADDRLRREALTAISGREWSRARRADVVVRGGTVHLWGVAPNEAVRVAYETALKKLPGVTDVVNHMHIAPLAHSNRL